MLLSDIGLRAAVEALNKASEANAAASQVWSAINHLESAEAALGTALERRRGLSLVRPTRLPVLYGRLAYVQCLMAICYRYLGEDALASGAFDRARTTEATEWDSDDGSFSPFGLLPFVVSPLAWVDYVSLHRAPKLDVDQVERETHGHPGSAQRSNRRPAR